METVSLSRWSEFQATVDRIREEHEEAAGGQKSQFLFRGQGNSQWTLESTLFRSCGSPTDFAGYYTTVARTVDAVASLTGKDWTVPQRPQIEELVARMPSTRVDSLPAYDYLVYLRHRGFPSPLLDWTTSPYVAAFFALKGEVGSDSAAIYCYVDKYSYSRGSSEPFIINRGPFVTTDPRHFAQKCWYTTALEFDGDSGMSFTSHQEVFDAEPMGHDILFKIEIPVSERISALRNLQDFNIDAFTLFQSEDALIESLALREFELDLP